MSKAKAVCLFAFEALLVLSACNLPVTPIAKENTSGIVVVSVSAASVYRTGPGRRSRWLSHAGGWRPDPGQLQQKTGQWLLVRQRLSYPGRRRSDTCQLR